MAKDSALQRFRTFFLNTFFLLPLILIKSKKTKIFKDTWQKIEFKQVFLCKMQFIYQLDIISSLKQMCYKIKLDSIGILIPQNGTKRNVQNINLHIKKRQPLPTAENEQLMHLSKNNQLKSNGGCYFAANFILFRNIAFYIKFSLNIIFLNFVHI